MDVERTEIEIKKTKVYSRKYNIEGTINDSGSHIRLMFSYDDRQITMGLSSKINVNYQEEGEQLIDSYIDNLYVKQDDTIRLNYWYLENADNQFARLRGVVTGHPEFNDGVAYWSAVERYEIDYDNDEMRAYFENLVYHCPLENMSFRKQNKRDPEHVIFPEFEEIEKRYKGKRPVYETEHGNVLLVLSNDEEYYFNSLYYKPDKDSEEMDYTAYPHTGNYQDSFLIMSYDNSIDIRFFPHLQYIEFYMQYTGGNPLYIENAGTNILYCMTEEGLIRLEPHDRKLVCKENVEKEKVKLPDGDLYPLVYE